MVAPGKYLEFQNGTVFRDKTRSLPGLEKAVVLLLQRDPDAGTAKGPGLRTVGLHFGGSDYTVVVGRVGQQVRLLDVFEEPTSKKELDAVVERFRKLFITLTQ